MEDARRKWDARWSEVAVPGDPAGFLVESVELFPSGGAALDVASGPGRHGLWLAGLGYRTSLVDISPVALEAARREAEARGLEVELIERDLETDGLPPGSWDLIVIHYFLDRALLATVPGALAPDGVVVFCQPTRRNLEAGDTTAELFLLDDAEIGTITRAWDLDILVLEEVRNENGRYEARVVARRPG